MKNNQSQREGKIYLPYDRMSTTMFDERLCGKRVKLIHTDDLHTKLKSGDMGTIKCTFLNLSEVVINVKWDSGSNSGFIVTKDDYEILE